ncbi:hypothetical protein ACFS07_02070 [Undibacterium arcticum]
MSYLPQKNGRAITFFSHGVLFDDIDPTSQVMLQNLVYESLLGLKSKSE